MSMRSGIKTFRVIAWCFLSGAAQRARWRAAVHFRWYQLSAISLLSRSSPVTTNVNRLMVGKMGMEELPMEQDIISS